MNRVDKLNIELLRKVEKSEPLYAEDRRAATFVIAQRARATPEKAVIDSVAYVIERRLQAKRDREQALRAMHLGAWETNLRTTRSNVNAPHGLCDCGCCYPFRSVTEGECDHWISRSQGGPDTKENGWRLRGGAGGCHEQKTNGTPSARDWDVRRRNYCDRAGIPFVARKERTR